MPWRTALSLTGMLLAASAAVAQDSPSSRVASVLRSLPEPTYRGAAFQSFTYFDLKAMEQAQAVERPGLGPLASPAREAAGRWGSAMRPVQDLFEGYPSRALLAVLVPEPEPSQDKVSALRLALAIDQVALLRDTQSSRVLFRLPPNSKAAALLKPVLGSRGFEAESARRKASGGAALKVWRAGETTPSKLTADPWDPIAPLLRDAASIVKDQNTVVLDSDEDGLSLTLDRATGSVASLADSARYAALLDALAEPQAAPGSVLRLAALEVHFPLDYVALRWVGPYASSAQRKAMIQEIAAQASGRLPPYETAVFMEQDLDGRRAFTFALVYEDPELAAAAVEALKARLEVFQPLQTKRPIMRLAEGPPEGLVHAAEVHERWVAVVRLWRKEGAEGKSLLANYLFDELHQGTLIPLTITAP